MHDPGIEDVLPAMSQMDKCTVGTVVAVNGLDIQNVLTLEFPIKEYAYRKVVPVHGPSLNPVLPSHMSNGQKYNPGRLLALDSVGE